MDHREEEKKSSCRCAAIEDVKFTEKMKEQRPLFVFILSAAVASVVIMNLIIAPITFFAVTFKSSFTKATIVFCLLLIAVYIIRRISILVHQAKDNGIPVISAFFSSAARRLRNLGYGITVIILSSILLFIIYMILFYNNNMIGQIFN